MRTRKLIPLIPASTGNGWLQWGRVVEDAEVRLQKLDPEERRESFNGAASLRTRKCCSGY